MSGRWRARSAIAAVVVVPALLAGAAVTQQTAVAEPMTHGVAQVRASHYSGEDIFAAINFGQGPVVAQFPEIKDAAAKVSKAMPQVDFAASEKFVAKKVAAMDPTFFARYQAEMTTGDPVAVRRALVESTTMVEKIGRAQLATAVNPNCAGVFVAIAAVIGAVVVSVAGAAVNIFYLKEATVQFDGVSPDAQASLAADQFIATAAQRLKA